VLAGKYVAQSDFNMKNLSPPNKYTNNRNLWLGMSHWRNQIPILFGMQIL
jgi:hypothetical protein